MPGRHQIPECLAHLWHTLFAKEKRSCKSLISSELQERLKVSGEGGILCYRPSGRLISLQSRIIADTDTFLIIFLRWPVRASATKALQDIGQIHMPIVTGLESGLWFSQSVLVRTLRSSNF